MVIAGLEDGYIKELVIRGPKNDVRYVYESVMDALSMDMQDCKFEIINDQLVMTLEGND